VRAFVSYAEEDRRAALRIARWLRDHGVEPFVFQEEAHRGGRFVREIEESLRQADLFLVLLSPAYVRSEWCRRERDVALTREVELGRQFIYVLEVASTAAADLGFLQSYSRLDATGRLDALAAALPLDGQVAVPPPAPRTSRPLKSIAVATGALALVAGVVFVLRPGPELPQDPVPPASASVSPTSVVAPSPGAAARGNLLTATPDKPGCSSSYLVAGVVNTVADRNAKAIWLVDELYASPNHNDPNDLYFAKVRVSLNGDGAFEVRIPANAEPGVRDGRLVLVASPTTEADHDLATSLDADRTKDGSYPDIRRTQLQLGNVEIATTADLHQAC
jgi:TIR domain-containing protein